MGTEEAVKQHLGIRNSMTESALFNLTPDALTILKQNVKTASPLSENLSKHPRSLISAFVVRCLDSIISLDSIAEISRLQLASVAAQAGLCLAWSETPEDRFSHGEAQMKEDLAFL